MGSSSLLLKLMTLLLSAAYALIATVTATATAAATPATNCNSKCGNVNISFPFGTTEVCFKDRDFQIICGDDNVPYLARDEKDIEDHGIQVLNISWATSEIHVSMPVFEACYDPKASNGSSNWYQRDAFWVPSKFSISNSKNKFNLLGCETYAFLYDRKEKRLNGCDSRCSSSSSSTDQSSSPPAAHDNNNNNNNGTTCSGDDIGCCQSDYGRAVSNYTINVFFYYSVDVPDDADQRRCSYAFLAQMGSSNFSDLDKLKESTRSTVVLDWAVDNRSSCGGACKGNNTECRESETVSGYYYCKCKLGFQGNPYAGDGCNEDVNECLDNTLNECLHQELCQNTDGGYECSCPRLQKGDGHSKGSGCSPIISVPLVVTIALLGVFALAFLLCCAHKQRTLKQLRQKNFEQNGGNLLLQQLSQQQSYTNKTRIFTKVELKNATNNFDETRILGRGGQGTVYKGILPDNSVVAIKKSRVGGDPQNIKSFINEVFVLSQVNHRHVVKLLGCCLETEVPLLVYEFVDNGTLLDHLDPPENGFPITWETRLRIATETAGAISYLHSDASIPIIHRDIKSANILLDNNNKAKVSDFGASRLFHLEEAQVATVVQGTIGYLDPEYLQTGQLNEKSDVYSFGIVLLELLTGIKAFEFNTLAKHFVSYMREDRLWEIFDKEVLKQKKNASQLKEVALLARRCIRVNGEERPTMKEVAMELEGIVAMEKHLQQKDKDMMVVEESEYLLGHCPNNDGYGSTSASFSVGSSHDSILKQTTFEIIGGGR